MNALIHKAQRISGAPHSGVLPKFRLMASRNFRDARVSPLLLLAGMGGENDEFKRVARGIGWTDN